MEQTLAIDLSGLNGLITKHQGDLYSSTSQPHLRYLASDGQMASGIWNPFKNYGYLSPTTKTVFPLTGTITNNIIASEYDSVSNVDLFAQQGITISKIDGLDDTSLTSYTTIPSGGIITDTELYQVNDSRALFYSYKTVDATTNTYRMNLGWKTLDESKGGTQLESKIIDIYGDNAVAGIEISSLDSQKLSQRFNTSDFSNQNSFSLTGIRLGLKMPYTGSSQTWTLKVSIQTSSAGAPSGTIVTSSDVTLNASSLPIGKFVSTYFKFASTVTLTSATEYWIVIEPTVWAEISSNEGVQWISSLASSNSYTNGITRGYNGSSWVAVTPSNASFDFSLLINTESYANAITNKIITSLDLIQLIDYSANYNAAATTLNTSLVVSSKPNTCVIVGVKINANAIGEISGVTCGGVSMTELVQCDSSATSSAMKLYYLNGVSSGTKTITASLSGVNRQITITAASFSGIRQAYPYFFTESDSYANTATIAGTSSVIDPQLYDNLAIGAKFLGLVFGANGGTDMNDYGRSSTKIRTIQDVQLAMFVDTGYKITPTGTDWNYGLTGSSSTTDYLLILMMLSPELPTRSSDIYSQVDFNENSTNFMCKADNGILYWFTGNTVHSFDGGLSGGGLGTLNPDVLVFPSYMRTVDAIDTGGLTYIGVQSGNLSGNITTSAFSNDICGVYVWDRQTTITRTRDYIPLVGVKEIRKLYQTREGDIRVIVINNDRQVEIRSLVNSTFQTLYVLNSTAYPEYRDSLTYINNFVAWQATDGKIYINGKSTPQDKEGLFMVGDLSRAVSGAFSPGILTAGDKASSGQRQALIASYVDGTTNKLSKFFIHASGTLEGTIHYPLQGDIFTPVYYLPFMSDVTNVRFNCIPGTNSTSDVVATIKLYFNQSSTVGMTKTVTKADVKKGYINAHINKQFVNSIQFEIEYNESMALSVDDFCPSMAIINYTQTTASTPSIS